MQLITFINFEDLPLLETGYTIKDKAHLCSQRVFELAEHRVRHPICLHGCGAIQWRVRAVSSTPGVREHAASCSRQCHREHFSSPVKLTFKTLSRDGLSYWRQEHRLPPHPQTQDVSKVSAAQKLDQRFNISVSYFGPRTLSRSENVPGTQMGRHRSPMCENNEGERV